MRARAARAVGALVLAAALLLPSTALAVGTPAGTAISNTASVTYDAGGVPLAATSNTDVLTVDELLDVDVTLQTVSPVVVAPGATGEVLTYLVTNLGNGADTYALAADASLGGDDFDPALTGIFLDTNGSGAYEPGVDAAYAPGVDDPNLDANGVDTALVFVVHDIPVGAADGERGDSDLTATSNTAFGPPGTLAAGAGEGGGDAVVGASGASGADLGSFQVSATGVSVVKSAAVSDVFGGSLPIPGATITYTLQVTVSGSATAQSVVITDPIPTNTTYVAGTLTLNAGGLTDAADLDAGDFDVTNPGEITVALGDLTAASPPQTIKFDVTID